MPVLLCARVYAVCKNYTRVEQRLLNTGNDLNLRFNKGQHHPTLNVLQEDQIFDFVEAERSTSLRVTASKTDFR